MSVSGVQVEGSGLGKETNMTTVASKLLYHDDSRSESARLQSKRRVELYDAFGFGGRFDKVESRAPRTILGQIRRRESASCVVMLRANAARCSYQYPPGTM